MVPSDCPAYKLHNDTNEPVKLGSRVWLVTTMRPTLGSSRVRRLQVPQSIIIVLLRLDNKLVHRVGSAAQIA